MPKYWGKQIFKREFPRSGSKAKDGEKNATSGGARKAPWAKNFTIYFQITFPF